jgi:hypothetical protein
VVELYFEVTIGCNPRYAAALDDAYVKQVRPAMRLDLSGSGSFESLGILVQKYMFRSQISPKA